MSENEKQQLDGELSDASTCSVCGDLRMIPSDDPNGDVMNTPCLECNEWAYKPNGHPEKGQVFVGFGFIGVVDKVIDGTMHYYMRPMGKGSMSLAAWQNVGLR